jgi:hypothetical protein
MPAPYINKTPHARCVLKIQDWLAEHMPILSRSTRDALAEEIVDLIADDIKAAADLNFEIKATDPDHVLHSDEPNRDIKPPTYDTFTKG